MAEDREYLLAGAKSLLEDTAVFFGHSDCRPSIVPKAQQRMTISSEQAFPACEGCLWSFAGRRMRRVCKKCLWSFADRNESGLLFVADRKPTAEAKRPCSFSQEESLLKNDIAVFCCRNASGYSRMAAMPGRSLPSRASDIPRRRPWTHSLPCRHSPSGSLRPLNHPPPTRVYAPSW